MTGGETKISCKSPSMRRHSKESRERVNTHVEIMLSKKTEKNGDVFMIGRFTFVEMSVGYNMLRKLKK
jgi:hypothetical protein